MTPVTKKLGRTSGSVRDAHRAWLELVDTEGPFIALPVLAKAFPQGIPQVDPTRRQVLGTEKQQFERARDAYEEAFDRQVALPSYRVARDTWVESVLRDLFQWGDHWNPNDPIARTMVSSPDWAVQMHATGALRRHDDVGALVWVIDPVTGLREACEDGWSDSPIDRMELLLRKAGLPIGIVTDGRWWGLVSAPQGTLAASGIVDAQTWIEEREVLDAFVALLSPSRLLGKRTEHRLSALFVDSVLAAEQITEALGAQVRRAVELVVAALDESAAEARHRQEPDPLPKDGDEIYAAVVTVLMRVVFLLFAEERGLLPTGELYSAGYSLSDQRELLERRARDENDEALDATSLTWHRLLATSMALYGGATFEDLRLPAYGGSLFDPQRFGFLTATTDRGVLALTVSDRVMLEVLRAIQTARIDGQLRRISFRDIDVEQIGYIYEGLLGFTCQRATKVTIGLDGKDGAEPEITLEELEEFASKTSDGATFGKMLFNRVKKTQPSAKGLTAAQYAKLATTGDSVEDAIQAVRSVTTDEVLAERLRNWIGLIRRDLRGRPVVALEGGLLVVETASRKNAGAHYTPRALAEEVVLHALEPIVYSPGPHQTADRSAWQLKSSTEILDLKVADIACGSGAFLVAAARYLAARLQEAWQSEGVSPELSPTDRETRALRAVVAYCLYGADINEMAVEMCKLSLWLVSLDRSLPFSFVDDKMLHGNSLLGLTSLRQLEKLHISPSQATAEIPKTEHSGKGQPTLDIPEDALIGQLNLSNRIQKAISLRHALTSEIDNTDPMRSAATKRNQMKDLAKVTQTLRQIADGVIAAGLPLGGKPGKQLNNAYDKLRLAARYALPSSDGPADPTLLNELITEGLTPTVETDYAQWQPLHWCLEVPDVMARGGFDAIVGNPPFLGGKKISPAMGKNMRQWCVRQIANNTTGNADLVSYFSLRATNLLRPTGTLGLIATNSIAQGDTREVGLDQMVSEGFIITRAIQSRPWPAASAKLEYACVWGTGGAVSNAATRVCDGVAVDRISPLLEAEGRVSGNPLPLRENVGTAFQGCIIDGKGFIIEPEEAKQWIHEEPRNAEVLSHFLNGDDIDSQPDTSPRRWIINFRELPESSAKTYTKPWGHVYHEVRPTRLQKDPIAYPRMVNEWWKFWMPRPNMEKAISGLNEILTLARNSNCLTPIRTPRGAVMSEQLIIFATDSYAQQAILSSSLHQMWAIKYTSTLGSGLRYTPSKVFMTFPRPRPLVELDAIGLIMHTELRGIMLRRNMGLTTLYNRINNPDLPDSTDPDVARLRQIHVDLDQAVMAAYGWDDIPLDHGFNDYRRMTRWTVSPEARVEILDRLLEENHRRAALQEGAPPADEDDGEHAPEDD